MRALTQMFGMAPTPLVNYAPEGLGRGFNTVRQLDVDASVVNAAVSLDGTMGVVAAHDGIADGPAQS